MKKLLSCLKSALSMPKEKFTIIGIKNAWFWVFLAVFWKSYCHVWNQRLQIFLIATFHLRIKIPKFGTKNVLFEHFWVGFLKSYFLHNWKVSFQKKILKVGIKNSLLGCFGQQFWKSIVVIKICAIAKFGAKMKTAKFGTKNVSLGYFWAGIRK